MQRMGPTRRITWVHATSLLSLGAALLAAHLDRGIGTLPVYQGQPLVGVLPPALYAALLLAGGCGLLLDLGGALKPGWLRRAVWGFAIAMMGVIAVYSLQAVVFGPSRPFAALALSVPMFLSVLTAWLTDGV